MQEYSSPHLMPICPQWWHISDNVKATSTRSSEQTGNLSISFKISWLANDNLRCDVAITFLDYVHLSQGFIHPKVINKMDEGRMVAKVVTYPTHLKLEVWTGSP